MKNLSKLKVGQIVASNFRTSKVLTAYDIDFCCNGGVTLEEACKNRNLSLAEVVSELEASFNQADERHYDDLSPVELIREIVKVHHAYVASTIPALRAYLTKLAGVHGERHPELLKIRDLFSEAADALTVHMMKEEQVLFPYVQAMAEAQEGGFELSRPHFGDIKEPIAVMEDDHQREGDRFREIAVLTNNYQCPKDGCQTYRVAFAMLQEFEQDLHKHIHLENNLLFPMAKKLFSQFEFKDDSRINMSI